MNQRCCKLFDKPPGKREDKLLAMLYDKRPLPQLAMYSSRSSHNKDTSDATIHSIHFRDYIELNTQFRTRAKNDFEKNYIN